MLLLQTPDSRRESHDLAARGERIDVCLIDGDHSYWGVRRDYIQLRGHCRFVVFHDVLDHDVRGGDTVRATRRALVARAQALFPRVDRVAEAVRKYERAEAARRERPAHE